MNESNRAAAIADAVQPQTLSEFAQALASMTGGQILEFGPNMDWARVWNGSHEVLLPGIGTSRKWRSECRKALRMAAMPVNGSKADSKQQQPTQSSAKLSAKLRDAAELMRDLVGLVFLGQDTKAGIRQKASALDALAMQLESMRSNPLRADDLLAQLELIACRFADRDEMIFVSEPDRKRIMESIAKAKLEPATEPAKQDICDDCREPTDEHGGGIGCPDGAHICRECFNAGNH